MAKIPYLIRRKNIFYFRLVVPAELRESVKVREIIQSLRAENREEATLCLPKTSYVLNPLTFLSKLL